MKDTVQAVAVQFDCSWLDVDDNARRMAEIVRAEADAGAELVVFPELCNAGYLPSTTGFDAEFAREYQACAETIPGPTTTRIAAEAARLGTYVTVGLLERESVGSTVLYNAMALVGPEGVVGVYRKVHLPVEEKLYFSPGAEIPVFDTPLGVIGMSICYDGRFPELTRVLTLRGAEIVCSGWAISEWPGVSNDESQKFRAYTRAQENGVYYLAASRSGAQGGRTFLGHSAVAAPSGAILAYSEVRTEDVLRAELTAEALDDYRRTLGLLDDRRPELYEEVVRARAEVVR